ncbi:MAG: hypothetical protein U9R38_03095 [Candidatus Margulisiibacteriota bacterium]|nr:hypothetical protein [Candidatus Margulisiibacteriota bacterium]
MKKALLLLLVSVLFCGSVFATWSSSITGKTMTGINYLTWGTFTEVTDEANSITTGLNTIYAFGTNVNTGETFVNNSTTESDALYAYAIPLTGSIEVKVNNNNANNGTWWAIGR